MEKFRELYIKVDKDDTAEFGAALNAALNDGWQRDFEGEKSARAHGFNDCEFFRYWRDDRQEREPAMLTICRSDSETLYVSNIVPLKDWRLTPPQYNRVLQDFHDNVLTKLEAKFSIIFMLGSDKLDIEHMMSPEVFKLLIKFSGTANKSTGSVHTQDRRRWFAFLVALSRAQHHLDAGSFRQWLIEAEKWPEKVAADLAGEFEFAIGLINFMQKA